MFRAFAVAARGHGLFVHREARFLQASGKPAIALARPDRQYSMRTQGFFCLFQTRHTVQPVIGFMSQAIGTIVDIKQDGIIFPVCRVDDIAHVTGGDRNTGIVETVLRQVRPRLACPFDDRWDEFHHFDIRLRG